jgi:ligand-binding sensor protein
MKITDIAPLKEWEQLANDIYEKFGLNGTINDKDGSLVAASSHWANKICPMIKGGKQSRVICATAQQYLAKLAQEKNKLAIGECDIGFTKFVVPIIYKDEFLGTAGGCGILEKDGEIEAFYIAKALNLKETEVEEHVSKIKTSSTKQLEAAIKYIKTHLEEMLENK